ncbi:hypothetical protein Ahy_A07g033526 [Arachis hypogaea]|uniref:Uncharacterized protein n=1 Tax=Arachis hypogaea TaxID=3818 RepID=A0A445C9L3_ARAHY|nr:hypothetical protein Ahy_A07g033526 [Arachis hypogaea]
MDLSLEFDSTTSPKPRVSYRDSLLVTPRPMENDSSPQSMDPVENKPNPEDRWYREEDALPKEEKSFDPCPEIKVMKEEFNEGSGLFLCTHRRTVDGCRTLSDCSKVETFLFGTRKGGLHLICFTRGLYGHRSKDCSENIIEEDDHHEEGTSVEGNNPGDQNALILTGESNTEDPIRVQGSRYSQSPLEFGPWMMLRRQIRKKSESARLQAPDRLPSLFPSLFAMWNCGGVGEKNFPTLIKDIRREYRASFCILLETHISDDPGRSICERLRFDNFFNEDARGFSDGIWCLWSNDCWLVDIIPCSSKMVHMEVRQGQSV